MKRNPPARHFHWPYAFIAGLVLLLATGSPAPAQRGSAAELHDRYFDALYAADPGAARIGAQFARASEKDAGIQNEFAWSLLTDKNIRNRDLVLAMEVARMAYLNAGGRDANIVDTYARAHYEQGDLDRAILLQHEAVRLNTNDTGFAETLERYQALKGKGSETALRASWKPRKPRAGDRVVIQYRPAGAPLDGAEDIYLHFGFNRWEDGSIRHEKMERKNDTTRFLEVEIPPHAFSVDFVFANGPLEAGNTRWDNHGGLDWRVPVIGGIPSTPKISALTYRIMEAPADIDTLTERGYSFAMMGREKLARQDFNAALQQGMNEASTRWSYGWALFNLGHFREAETLWEAAAESWPGHAFWAPYTLALAAWANGNTDRALPLYDHAARSMPERFGSREALTRYTSFWSTREQQHVQALYDAWAKVYRSREEVRQIGAITSAPPAAARTRTRTRTMKPEPATPDEQHLPWEKDYPSALARANAENRPLFIMLTAEWCGWCRRLEQDTFSHPEVKEALAPFVAVRVFEDQLLNRKYHMRGYPTLVFADAQENAAHSFAGYKQPLPFLKEVAAAGKALGLELPESLRRKADTVFTPDVALIDAFLESGDADKLEAHLRPAGQDELSGMRYLIAEIPRPEGMGTLPLDVFWRYSYMPVPSNGLVLLVTESASTTFRLTVPGFRQIHDDSLLATSVVARRTFVLSRLGPEDGVALSGVALKPDGTPASGALIRLYDWDTIRADEEGRFLFSAVSPGAYTLAAEGPGFELERDVEVSAGKPMNLTLETKPALTVHLRWVYQASEGSTALVGEGTTAGEAFISESRSRFSFRRGHPLNNWGSDMMMRVKDGRLVYNFFDSGGKKSGFHPVDEAFEDVVEADHDFYYERLRDESVEAGQVYLVSCLQGNHYAKAEIIAIHPPFPGD